MILTGKSLAKIRKTVYGNFFRKPFSKTRVRLPRPFHSSHSVSALSLSHYLLSSHSPNLSHPSHPQQPPTATPCLALHPLSHPVSRTPPESPQPEPPSTPFGLYLALADRRSPRCPPICRRSDRTRVTPTRATLSPSWSLSRTRRSPISTVPPICSFSISDPLVF